MLISLITTSSRYVPMISLTFKVLNVKLCSLMLCLSLSVPEDVPGCSASTLVLLASFINSVDRPSVESYTVLGYIIQHIKGKDDIKKM